MQELAEMGMGARMLEGSLSMSQAISGEVQKGHSDHILAARQRCQEIIGKILMI